MGEIPEEGKGQAEMSVGRPNQNGGCQSCDQAYLLAIGK